MEHDEDIFGDEFTPDPKESQIDPIFETEISDDNFLEPTKIEKSENSIISSLLKTQGIENNLVTIVGEDGVEQQVDFYELPESEQLEILTANSTVNEFNLNDSELQLVNLLRENNLTIDQYLELYKQQILTEASTNQQTTYDIDAYTDQELFLLDLKNRFEDLTDEELALELETELKKPEIFARKTAKLRAEYKQLEDLDKENKANLAKQNQEMQYQQFADQMVSVATNTNEFHGITVEDEEKQKTLQYLLALDNNGTSKFALDLNDPKKLYEAAWYLLYGKEAFSAIEQAYESEIAKLKQDKPRVVVRNTPTNQPRDINDLH